MLLFEGVYHALAAAVLTNDDAKSLANLLAASKLLHQALDDLHAAKEPRP